MKANEKVLKELKEMFWPVFTYVFIVALFIGCLPKAEWGTKLELMMCLWFLALPYVVASLAKAKWGSKWI